MKKVLQALFALTMLLVFLLAIANTAAAEHPCADYSLLNPPKASEIIQKVNTCIRDKQVGSAKCLLEGYIVSYNTWTATRRVTNPLLASLVVNDNASIISAASIGYYTNADSSFWVARGDDSTFAIFTPWAGQYSGAFIITACGQLATMCDDWEAAYLGYQGMWADGLSRQQRKDYKMVAADSIAKQYCTAGDSSSYFKHLSDLVELPDDEVINRPTDGLLVASAYRNIHLGEFVQPTGYAAGQFHRIGSSKLFVSNDWQGWRFFYFEGYRNLFAIATETAFELPQARR